MRKLFRVLIFAATTCSLAIKARGEDLSGYDKLGPLEQNAAESPVPIERQIRKFVWDHWNGKRRGYVAVTFHTKEGEPTTEFMWIEPTAGGSWHIRGKIESTYSHRRMVTDPNKQPDRHETRTFEAVRIVRVGNGVNARLAFKDSSDKTVGSF